MPTTTVQTVSLASLKNEEIVYIDVRTPAEFQEYKLPNAINIPLFTNEERAKVGTVYKQKSREEAIELGISIYAPKWLTFFKKIKMLHEENPGKKIVIYCWRGGMRSKTVAGTLGLVGIKCYQLVDGIRSFRQATQQCLAYESEREREFIVLSGHTGTRKTEILHDLQKKGYPVLDLEGLAGHRGSVFGHIGVQPKSQKQFECDLVNRLQELEDFSYVIIEAESNRIGNVILPSFISKGRDAGRRISLKHPFPLRVEHIHETYRPDKYGEKIDEAISKISKFLTPELSLEVSELREKGEYKLLFARLLENYYDPRYEHSYLDYQTDTVSVVEFEKQETAVQEIITYLDQYEKEVN